MAEEASNAEVVNKPGGDQERCRNCGGKSHLKEYCPHKEQGTRCFRCNEFGHIGKNCPGKPESSSSHKNISGKADETNEVNVNQVLEGLHLSSWRLLFQHGKRKVKAVVCLSLQESFIRESCVHSFDYGPRVGGAQVLATIHNKKVQTLGSYEFHMVNDGEGHYIECHVIQDDAIYEQMLLGKNFVKTVEIVVRKGKVLVRRLTNESDDESTGCEDNARLDWWNDAK